MSTQADLGDGLASLPATEVKKQGWRGVMRAVAPQGKLAITHHNELEAVIVSAKEWARIAEVLAKAESEAHASLEALRQRFDERLAALAAPDAGDRLRAIMQSPARLEGDLKAGSYD